MSFFHSALNRKILLLVLLFTGLGLVQVYSASYIFSIEKYQDGLFFLKKQTLFAIIGLTGLFFIASLSWKWARFIGIGLWFFSILMLIATLIPQVSVSAGGAQRWLSLPFGFHVQPSELFKITTPFALIYLIAIKDKNIFNHPVLFWVLPVFAFGLPLLVLSLQPDFGTIVLLCCVALSVIFILGLKWRYILLALIFVFAGMFLMVIFEPYRLARIQSFLNPWSDSMGTGFQVIQSMITFHSGGFFGVGLGQGQGKLFFLPEAHTDFTLAVLVEETGLLGFLVIMSLYALLIYYGTQISLRTKDTSQKVLAFSLIMVFAFSVVIHTGVNLGIMPPKGLTLPFISYGGSSLICHLLLFGWLLNMEKNNYFVY